MPDPTRSRPHPKTFTAVQWHAMMTLMMRGLEASGDDAEAKTVRELLPDLKRDVSIMRDLEPVGCGLDRGDREDP